MNTTMEYTKFLLNTRYEDLPAGELNRFKARFLDSIGVMAAGTHGPVIENTIDLFKKMGGVGEASVMYHGIKLPAQQASFVNSIMLRSFDYEPCGNERPDYTTGPAHVTGSTLPCTLAVAEITHASGKDAILANVLGDDLTSRLAQSTGFDFHQGWDNTGTINGLGCTAIAAKLFGFDAEKTCNAFGIDIHTIGGSFDGVKDGTYSFKIPHGLCGMNAIMSARFADIGFSGIKDAFTGRHGYFNLFGTATDKQELLLKDLGKFYYSDGGIKPWPACRLTHSPIQLCLEMREKYSINSKDIEKINLYVDGMADLVDRPFEPVAQVLMFNVRYVVAVALTQGEVLPLHHSEKYQLDPEIQRLAGIADVIYTEQEHALSADVELIMKDGTVYKEHLYHPLGDFKATPMTREQLLGKFYKNMDYSGMVSSSRADEIVDAIDHFEDIKDVNEFIELLCKK